MYSDPVFLGAVLVKLALAAGRGSELTGARALIAVDGRASDAAHQHLGDTVLVYLHVNGVVLDYVGQGRVVNVGLSGAGRVVIIDPYRPFAAPVSGETERDMPGARRMLELADERFDEILTLAQVAGPVEAQEVAASFTSKPTEATYTAIRDQVLRVWRYRCTFTGAADAPNSRLSIVAIRPRDQGGPLHVGNYLPMIAGLERAWRSGHFSVGDDHRILGDLYRLAPEDQDSMVALFKMLLPDAPKDYPDPQLLAWHRLNVFGRS
jgi:hypothetical protein